MTKPETITGVIIVDHGSRREASNQMLLQAVEAFRATSQYRIVEPAHMELADPDIATAFERCTQQGATQIVVFPYFLSPGRHWSSDIPSLVAAAAKNSGVEWIVTAPFGLHPLLTDVIHDRIQHCLRQASSDAHQHCDACDGETACQFHLASDE
jgi:sirohydrochlorin ferrochelatase